MSAVLAAADGLMRRGLSPAPRVWATGFAPLDSYLSGGLRAGELTLLGGPQGLGKTTLALQVIRNVASAGGSALYFSFEHDEQSLLERLLCVEAAEIAGAEGMTLAAVRHVFEDVRHSDPLTARLARLPGGSQALRGVGEWGERVQLHRSAATTTVAEIENCLSGRDDQPLVVVDYLQKVAGTTPGAEDERVTDVVENLKDMALRLRLPVLAIVAADKEGITQGRRLRIHHLRGSSALAYEADVVLLLNDKFDVVARHHLVYDVGNAERFRGWVVMSIEKNRGGLDRIDLEFCKRFAQGCFDPVGRAVGEQLVDERMFVE